MIADFAQKNHRAPRAAVATTFLPGENLVETTGE